MLCWWSVYIYSTQDDNKSSRDVASVVYRLLESAARARERTQKAALLKLEKIEKFVHFNVIIRVILGVGYTFWGIGFSIFRPEATKPDFRAGDAAMRE